MELRLTTGENGTPWGKQQVLAVAEFDNSADFVAHLVNEIGVTEDSEIWQCGWIDSGDGSIPLALSSLNYAVFSDEQPEKNMQETIDEFFDYLDECSNGTGLKMMF